MGLTYCALSGLLPAGRMGAQATNTTCCGSGAFAPPHQPAARFAARENYMHNVKSEVEECGLVEGFVRLFFSVIRPQADISR